MTSIDPGSHPEICHATVDIDGTRMRHRNYDDKETFLSIMWDGKNIFFNGSKTAALEEVPGPVWAVLDIGWWMTRLSVFSTGELRL